MPAITLVARELSKSFSGAPLFSRLSFRAGVGLTAVSGPNGSGKTTLLKVLARLIRPTAGTSVLLEGEREIEGEPRRHAVGWAGPDLAFYDDFTARENLAFFLRAAGHSAVAADVDTRLARVALGPVANRRVGAFSTGMKQRLRLAFSVLLDPAVLLLDEPTAGLDEDGRTLVAAFVAQERAARVVLLASNDSRDFVRPDGIVELGR